MTILVLVVAVALWWFWRCSREFKKHEEVQLVQEDMNKKLKDIEQEYRALTGKDIRKTLSETEVYETFHELFKQRGIHLTKPDEKV